MNSDSADLTDFDRFNLVASESHVMSLLSQCKFPECQFKVLLPEEQDVP